MNKEESRPDFCTDEHLVYLDELREMGVSNMFGARPYLLKAFGRSDDALTPEQASAVLSYWMHAFGKGLR